MTRRSLPILAILIAGVALPTRPAAAPAVRRSLPILVPRRGAPITPRPITLNELRRREPTLRLDSTVTLKRGKTLRVSDALVLLNQVERELNALGISLRTPRRKPVLVLTPIRVNPVTVSPAGTFTPQSDVPFTPFASGVWRAIAGDTNVVAAEILHSTALQNTAPRLSLGQDMAIGAYLFGSYLPISSARGLGSLPAALDGCSGTASVVLPWGSDTRTGSCTGTPPSLDLAATQTVSGSVEEGFTQPIWGPFEVTVRGILTADGTLGSTLAGQTHQLTSAVSTTSAVWLSLQILGGVYLVDAGVQADLLLARYTLQQRSLATTVERPSPASWSTTDITWSTDYTRTFQSLDGSISLVLVFDLPFFDPIVIDWEIYAWDGATLSQETSTWGPFTGIRPGVCTSTSVASGAMCSGACVSLASDVNNCGTCGHVCSGGPNPSCEGGTCRTCRPSCGMGPGTPDGCGGTCAACPSNRPYWCELLGACTTSQMACTNIYQHVSRAGSPAIP